VLAPWLLTTGVLAAAPAELVPLTFDPAGADAQQYALTLSTAFPGERPSVAGYLAWAGDQPLGAPPAPALYAAAPVNKLANANDGMQTGHSAVDWYFAGSLTRIGAPLTWPPSPAAVRGEAPSEAGGGRARQPTRDDRDGPVS
jgi:hypothetical protein